MKKFWILAAFAAMFASCSNDQDSPSSVEAKGDTELKIGGSSDQLVVTKANVNLTKDTKIGVYAYIKTGANATTLTTTPFKNAEYVAVGTDNTFTSLAPINLYHANTYNAIAYAPRVSAVTDPAAVEFTHGSDVLYAAEQNVTISALGTTPETYKASTDFIFKHMLSQIKFTLVEGTGYVATDLVGATYKVTGLYGKCTMNLNTGVITPTPVKVDDATTSATITEKDKAMCFIPSSSDMTLEIEVTLANATVCKGTLVKTFTPGSSYSYNLKVNKNDAKLEVTGQVVDWVPVSGGDINIEG